MNDLLKTEFFGLMNENSQAITNKEMQRAYGCFMKGVETASQSETDYSKLYRTLNITRIELVSIQTLYRDEQGKKCPKIHLFAKSISYCLFRIGTAKSQNSLP